MSCCGGHDSDLKDSKPRGCTDVLCLAIFAIFWGLLIFVAAFSFVIGAPMRLAYGQDSFGNTCGMRNEELGNMTFSGMDHTDRPYLFFLNVSNLRESLKICVKKCPDRTLHNEEDVREFERTTGSNLCRYDVALSMQKSVLYPNPSGKNLKDDNRMSYHACPQPPIYGTKLLLNRCVPSQIAHLAANIMYDIYAYLNNFDIIQQVVSDIYAGRYEILGMSGLSLLLSFLMAFTIHYLASFVAWIIMVVAAVASVAGTAVLWWTYADIKWHLDLTPYNQLLAESAQNEHTFLVYSILATVFTVALLLIILVLRKRVHVVARLFTESGRCIRSMPLLLLQPLWTFISLALFFAFWVAVLLALATAYYPVKSEMKNPPSVTPVPSNLTELLPTSEQTINVAFSSVSFTEGSWVRYMWWYLIVALVWTSEFLLGCQQMVIAGSVATWYFSRDRDKLSCTVGRSTLRLLLYHTGSVALGSFLITLFKIPRLVLTYVIAKMQKRQHIVCVSWCLRCCTCCLWCMEKCIRYLNHNAYTIVAIRGISFCPAARDAFDVLVSNALQVATINSVGDFILFLGKCGVTAITAFVGVLVMRNDPDLHFYAIPVFLVAVFSYFVAHCVLSVYEMVIDTLFLCCCEDLSRNDGSEEKPYFGGSLVRYLKGGEGGQPLNRVGGDTSGTE